MKKFILAMLLLSVALAIEIDPETGCEIYSDHLLCPQSTDIEAHIRFTNETLCPSILNNYGRMEEAFCISDAVLERDVTFKECMMYVPFTPSDIVIEGIDTEFDCRETTWRKGSELTVVGFSEYFTGCTLTEQEEWYEVHTCPTDGKRYFVSGAASVDGGDKILMMYDVEKQMGVIVDDMALIIIIVVAAIIFFFVMAKWGKEK